jgi:hypothetical protein
MRAGESVASSLKSETTLNLAKMKLAHPDLTWHVDSSRSLATTESETGWALGGIAETMSINSFDLSHLENQRAGGGGCIPFIQTVGYLALIVSSVDLSLPVYDRPAPKPFARAVRPCNDPATPASRRPAAPNPPPHHAKPLSHAQRPVAVSSPVKRKLYKAAQPTLNRQVSEERKKKQSKLQFVPCSPDKTFAPKIRPTHMMTDEEYQNLDHYGTDN